MSREEAALQSGARCDEPPRAVIFDLDQTLYPYRSYVSSGLGAVALHMKITHGIELDTEPPADPKPSDIPRLLAERMRPHFREVDPRTVYALLTVLRCHKPRIALMPDVIPALATLRCRDVKIGVVCPGNPREQQLKLTALSAHPWLDTVIFAGETDASLGMEYAFWLAAMDMDVGVDETLFVGCNGFSGFADADRAGMRCVAVRRAASGAANLDSDTRTVNTIRDLSAVPDFWCPVSGRHGSRISPDSEN
jgi:FMN phosphatase YigB (HAD superfamily)